MKILITGFEPFGDHNFNPSEQLMAELPNKHQDAVLIKGTLPVHNQLGPQKLLSLLEEHQPDAVIAFGLASGRAEISLERVAINLMDYSIADNAGNKIENQPIIEGSPAAYFSTLPLQKIHRALIEAGIPSQLSLSAGAYLCNQVFYTLMHTINLRGLNINAGFVHLPDLPEQVALSQKSIPSMSFSLIHQAAILLIENLII